AIPYERIADEVMLGLVEPANSLCPPSHPFYNDELPRPYYTNDLDKARECLLKAGYPEWPPEEQIIPTTDNLMPTVVGAVAGIVIGAVAVYFMLRKR
ncbi:unnamed protein product, partial [marine sediment metagenome]